MQASILRDLPPGPIQLLATNMLTDTVQFVNAMCFFVTTYYDEMANAAAMTPTEAWLLTMKLLKEILLELYTARNIVMHSRIQEPLLHIWGALKTHAVMQRFVGHLFRDDPSLNGILVRQVLAGRNDDGGLSGLNRKHQAAENRLKSAEQAIRTLQGEMKKKKDKE